MYRFSFTGIKSAAIQFVTLCLLLATFCNAHAALKSVRVAAGLTEPVFVTAPKNDSRLFIVERAGFIRILKNGSVLGTPFLDISSLVSTTGAFGFFGVAFAPDYASSGLFYVYYVNTSDKSVVGRYQVSANPDIANASGETVIEIDQTLTDHNGGTIAFSPVDGYLYLAPGDGGGGRYDPDERGQDPNSLLGKMLRIDVSGGPGTTYSVPPNNPFVADPAILDEIWSFGLRNPFRWGFDRITGDLWIGDIGQEAKEEILFEPPGTGGRNYGWDVMEGTLCVTNDPAPAPPCNDPSLTLPYYEYDHNLQPMCSGSVTGGYVYRGPLSIEEHGRYFFGDYCTGQIWTLDPLTVQVTDRTAELTPSVGGHTIDPFTIVGFGEDGFGELYVVDYGGEIFRIESDEVAPTVPIYGLEMLALILLAVGWWCLRYLSKMDGARPV